ncbi:MAG TPA: hypothetical protein VJH92_01580 [Candidatus Nanoarchaeia archaeon]|nr:hypothetical protein [Candidatus Nanoarchaeia archaeon]
MAFKHIYKKVLPYVASVLVLASNTSKAGEDLSFEVGKNTKLEQRVNVDIVSDYSIDELYDLSKVTESINSKYPNLLKKLNVVIDRSEYNFKSSSSNNATDSRFKDTVDLISISEKEYIELFDAGLLWGFRDNLAHEFGHLAVNEYISLSQYGSLETKTDSLFLASIKDLPEDAMKEAIRNRRASQKLRRSFLDINSSVPEFNHDLKDRQIGYVSKGADYYRSLNSSEGFPYDGTKGFNKQPKISSISLLKSLEEDIAETFTYIFNDYNYADNDSFVQEKIRAINEFMKTVYGNK